MAHCGDRRAHPVNTMPTAHLPASRRKRMCGLFLCSFPSIGLFYRAFSFWRTFPTGINHFFPKRAVVYSFFQFFKCIFNYIKNPDNLFSLAIVTPACWLPLCNPLFII
ncbi:hypothetical protein A3860_22130 [Niastella vici]|uniref:Uncharacterized protein n=1 Tax=Niastella vici TaxID=1703345 RepID=A0A1V9G0K7_9BACT|nr:hypothetical protein A3860_22130 [Niastella vici]